MGLRLSSVHSFVISVFVLAALAAAPASTAQSAPAPDMEAETAKPDDACVLREGASAAQLILKAPCPDVRFNYSFRPAKPGAPTVLYFGGGPSQAIVGSSAFPIPEDFGLLRFDYPGIGCNQSALKCERWSSERIAEAVLEIVQEKQLRNYFVYGLSYGTVPATIFVALLEGKDTLSRPRFLLLESSIGRAFAPGEIVRNYREEWQKVLDAVPKKNREEFERITQQNCSAEVWGAWAEHALSIGAGPGEMHLAQEMIMQLSSNTSLVGFCSSAPAELLSESARRLYRQVVCRELNSTAPDHSHSFRLSEMRLRPRPGNACAGVALDRPYEAAQWRLTHTPIIYVYGDRDPATPARQTRYHRKGQPDVGRLLIKVKGAAHNPLAVGLSDCAPELLQAFQHSTAAVRELLDTRCRSETELRVYRPRAKSKPDAARRRGSPRAGA